MLYNLSLAAGECTPHTTYWRPNGYEHGSRRVSTTQSHGMHDRLTLTNWASAAAPRGPSPIGIAISDRLHWSTLTCEAARWVLGGL